METRVELGSSTDGAHVLHRYFLEVLWGAHTAIYVHSWTFPEGEGESGVEFLPLSESGGRPFADQAQTAARLCLAR
jgi:hypothetical protein